MRDVHNKSLQKFDYDCTWCEKYKKSVSLSPEILFPLFISELGLMNDGELSFFWTIMQNDGYLFGCLDGDITYDHCSLSKMLGYVMCGPSSTPIQMFPNIPLSQGLLI